MPGGRELPRNSLSANFRLHVGPSLQESDIPDRIESSRLPLLALLACSGAVAALLAPALFNRFPLLMVDSWRYMDEAAGAPYWISSQFYGYFLRPFLGSTLWLVIAVQALVSLYVLQTFFRRVCAAGVVSAAIAVALLALTSSLGLFASAVMTDLWFGLGVVAASVLAVGERARLTDAAMTLVVAFAAVAHPAAFVLLGLVGGAGVAIVFGVRIFGRRPFAEAAAPGLLAAALGVAVVGLVVNNAVVWGKARPNAHSMVSVFSYLFVHGDLDEMLEGCTEWKVCTARGRPDRSETGPFTWYMHSERSPLHGQLGGPEAYVDEATEIVVQYLTSHPIAYARRVVATGWEQLFQVSGARHTRMMTRRFREDHPDLLDTRYPGDGPRLAASRQYRKDLHLREIEPMFTVVAWLGVAAALAGGVAWFAARRRGLRWPAPRKRVAVAALGMLAVFGIHAFSIGTSHYPVERYGARVQWLVALALWMWVVRLYVEIRDRSPGKAA